MRAARVWLAALAASLLVTRVASASELPASVFLINLVPSSLGLDTQLRVPIGWPIQIPLGRIDGPRRLVLTPRVVIWAERPLVTFDLRAGYRTNLPVHVGPRTESHVELFAGLGSTLEIAPVVRPLLSPEIGIRFGRMGTGALGVLFATLQGDFGFATRGPWETPVARGTLAVGWALY